MQQLTYSEWKNIPQDYRGFYSDTGLPNRLILGDKGTTLVPVEITDLTIRMVKGCRVEGSSYKDIGCVVYAGEKDGAHLIGFLDGVDRDRFIVATLGWDQTRRQPVKSVEEGVTYLFEQWQKTDEAKRTRPEEGGLVG